MRALSYRGPHRLRVVDKPLPRLSHPRDAILRVTRTAICGSDVHLYGGLVPDTRVGCTFGHEFTGVVEELGREVTNLAQGDRVVVPFNIACGACFFCRKGLYSSCDQTNPNSGIAAGSFGHSHLAGGYEGAQAEYVRVPYADVGPAKIPDELEDEDVLFLADSLPTGWQAVEMGELGAGDSLAVFGCGPVGLFAIEAAIFKGAARVFAIDRVPARLERARQLGPVETIDFSSADPVLELRQRTEGRGPDVCIDAVGLEAGGSTLHRVLGRIRLEAGAPTALNWALEAVRSGGRVSVVGVYAPPWNLVAVGVAMAKGLTLRLGYCNVKRYLPELLEHVRAGRLRPRSLITHRLPLEEASAAYRLAADKSEGCIKCVLTPATA